MNGTSDNPENLTRVGYFHFGKDWHLPIPALAGALAKACQEEELNSSLIVLPEAFNIRQHYLEDQKYVETQHTDPEVLDDLQGLSHRFNVAFVAGLIIKESNSVDIVNTAYLIDAQSDTGYLKLCSKENCDHSKRYTPRCDDARNPIDYRGLWITTLICMDSYQDSRMNKERHDSLETISRSMEQPKVVCIPAHIGRSNRSMADRWLTSAVVLANSNATRQNQGGLGSFVLGPAPPEKNRRPLRESYDSINEVQVMNLES